MSSRFCEAIARNHKLSLEFKNFRKFVERIFPDEAVDVILIKVEDDDDEDTLPESKRPKVSLDGLDGDHPAPLRAHRAVLSAFSGYFKAMFEGDWKKKTTRKSRSD